MSESTPDPSQSAHDQDTVRERLRKYERREGMIVWVGAGLAALIALIALSVGDTSDEVPALLQAIAVTAVVVSGAALAYARVNFEWSATVLKRKIEDGELQNTDRLSQVPDDKLPASLRDWPEKFDRAWHWGRLAIYVAAVAFLASVWWSVIAALLC